MPELAASYVVGFFVVLAVASFSLWRESKLERSLACQLLSTNLAQVGARWSHSQDTIITSRSKEGQSLSHVKTLAAFGLGCAFLSWFGLFFFALILLSRKAVMHKGRGKIVESPLATEKFDSPVRILEEMQKFLADER